MAKYVLRYWSQDSVPYLYFSSQKTIFRKNLIDFYLLDEPDVIFEFVNNVVSMDIFAAK